MSHKSISDIYIYVCIYSEMVVLKIVILKCSSWIFGEVIQFDKYVSQKGSWFSCNSIDVLHAVFLLHWKQLHP